jgi:hypothetical protein
MEKRIPQARAQTVVIFHGYDGKDYTAHVESVRKGVAKLLYKVTRHDGSTEWINAYISDPSRIA